MYKLYCDCCDNKFSISDETMDKFTEDDDLILRCPRCNDWHVNLIETGLKQNYK